MIKYNEPSYIVVIKLVGELNAEKHHYGPFNCYGDADLARIDIVSTLKREGQAIHGIEESYCTPVFCDLHQECCLAEAYGDQPAIACYEDLSSVNHRECVVQIDGEYIALAVADAVDLTGRFWAFSFKHDGAVKINGALVDQFFWALPSTSNRSV